MHTLLHSVPPALQQATANPFLCWRLTAKSGSVSYGSLLLPPGSWCAQGFVCALQESVSPVLCKFWWPYGGVNGDLLQEGLCHTQVYCTQSCCPCCRPLLTCKSTGDTQTQFWLSLLWGHCSFLLGPGAHKVLFVPSKSRFPQPCGSSVIKSLWPPKSNSLRDLSSFASSSGWGICSGP